MNALHATSTRWALTTAVVALLTVTFPRGQPLPIVTSANVKDHVGETANVCGQVTDYGCRDIDYVSFFVAPGIQRAGDKRLQIRLLGKNRSTYMPRLEEQFLFQVVCTQGKVEEDRSAYFVSVPAIDAIQIQPQTPPISVVPFAPGAYSNCDPGIVPPRVTRQVEPEYPRSALGSGVVILRTVVETNGQAGDIQVLVSASPEFDQAAGRMLRQWRFAPGTFMGKPVPVIFTVQASFGFR
jgi:TonB family protein